MRENIDNSQLPLRENLEEMTENTKKKKSFDTYGGVRITRAVEKRFADLAKAASYSYAFRENFEGRVQQFSYENDPHGLERAKIGYEVVLYRIESTPNMLIDIDDFANFLFVANLIFQEEGFSAENVKKARKILETFNNFVEEVRPHADGGDTSIMHRDQMEDLLKQVKNFIDKVKAENDARESEAGKPRRLEGSFRQIIHKAGKNISELEAIVGTSG